MTAWIETLDNWNPQFLRECRGRLKPRTVFAAVGLSTIVQTLLGLFVAQALTFLEPQEQWLRICQTLTWCIPYALFVIGGYYLVSDLTQEEKRGTLNFIRLSPRPAHEILLGKLLGVPILPCLLVASAIPLQVVSALMSGISLTLELSYYLTLGVSTVLVFSLAMLAGLTGSQRTILVGQQAPTAISFAGIALLFLAPTFMFWNQYTTWYSLPGRELLFGEFFLDPIEWLYLPISSQGVMAHLFMLGSLSIVIVLIWQILRRQFQNPAATLLSKRLSYFIVAYLNVLVWGFFQSRELNNWDQEAGIVFFYILNFGLFLFLYFGLSPQRQLLLDWQRYRVRSSWLDWAWGDKSPAVIAIAINYLIATGLILPWCLLQYGQESSPLGIVLAFTSVGLSFITYATLVQTIFSTRVRNPYIWGVGALAIAIFVPLILMAIFQISPDNSSHVITIWTFLGYPFWDLNEPGIISGIGIGILLQCLFLGVLSSILKRNLKALIQQPQ